MAQKVDRRRPAMWLRLCAVLAVFTLVALTLRERLPSLAEVSTALGGANTRWLIVATVAEIVSMGMFARQQRRLLLAFGVPMTRHRSIALAYSRSAIAISLPAGSAITAAYAFRQFRTGGATRRTAATVMILSGVLSTAALALLYATGALAAATVKLGQTWRTHPVLTLLSAVVLLIVVGLLAWRSLRHIPPNHLRHQHTLVARLAFRWPRLAAALASVADAVSSTRAVPTRHWALALTSAVANWLTDLLCLYAAARAFGLPLDLVTLGAIYLTVQIIRQIPLTPGGIGIIEISLLAGLVSAGADQAAAAATVLVYRLLSCWLIIPVGALSWLLHLRRPPSGNHPVDDAPDALSQPATNGATTPMPEPSLLTPPPTSANIPQRATAPVKPGRAVLPAARRCPSE